MQRRARSSCPEGAPRVSVRYHFTTIGSTNARAVELLDAGETPPFWVTAGRQIMGRGRLGRSWTSEPGNLYATLAFHANVSIHRLPELSFVLAVALRRAVVEVTADERFSVKWPNDLMHGRRKLAGLLLERVGERDVLAGFGVNCTHAPPDLGNRAASLTELGHEVEPDRLLDALDHHAGDALSTWEDQGFERLRNEWRDHAFGLGEPATVRGARGTTSGIAEDIDDTGRLLLRTPNGVETISAGDWLPDDAAASETRSYG